MSSNCTGVICFLLIAVTSVKATPTVQHQYCPVVKESEGLSPGSKVIDMDAVEGRKVRLQFSYPNENFARKLQDFSVETTTMDIGDTATTPIPNFNKFDIFCQWHFKV